MAHEMVNTWAVSGVARESTASLPSLTRSILSVVDKVWLVHQLVYRFNRGLTWRQLLNLPVEIPKARSRSLDVAYMYSGAFSCA